MQDLNTLAQRIHENAKAKGFWDAPRNTGEVFMLIVSELGEALEAHRSGKRADMAEINESISRGWAWEDSPISFEHMFKQDIKDTFEDEIADVVIRILDWCAYADLTIDIPLYEMHGDFDFPKDSNIGEVLLDITAWICRARRDVSIDTEACFNAAVILCCNLADAQDFDLMRHIELKMQYNATRERLHGKKY